MRSLVTYKLSPDTTEATTLVPDMATDTGRPNADVTSWSFTLRDGLTWQDGSPVVCDDIKYGVSRTFATVVINGGPTYATTYLSIPRKEDGTSQYPGPYEATPDQQALFDAAVVCDGQTITFNLNQPVPDFNFTTTLGFGAVPNPHDHPGADKGDSYVGDKVWSDGPYKITTYNGGSLKLDRNDAWSADSDPYRAAYPDHWEVDFGLDLNVIDERLMGSSGNNAYAIDYGGLQPDNLRAVFADSHTANSRFADRAFSDYDQYVRYYWINTKLVPNRDIRAAMAAALDRDAIRQNAGGAFVGDFADGLLKPNIGLDYAPTDLWNSGLGQPIPPTGDPDYAKTLIAQSGQPAPKLTWSYPASPTGDANATIIKQSLEKAGFTVKLDRFEIHSCYSPAYCGYRPDDFGAAGWGTDWPDASTVFPALLTGQAPPAAYGNYTEPASFNLSHVDDTSGIPDWTAQVKDAQTTIDPAAEALKWQKLNKEAVDQVWVIPLFFSLSQHVTGTSIGGAYRWAPYASWPYANLYAKPD